MEEDGRRMRALLALVLAGIVVGGAVDLVLDAPQTWRSGHVLFEVGLVLAALATAVWLWRNWRRASDVAMALGRSLAERQAERDAWRERASQAPREPISPARPAGAGRNPVVTSAMTSRHSRGPESGLDPGGRSAPRSGATRRRSRSCCW